ncbi:MULTISPECIES: GNAT family N-acetyltransferase [unclassified Streptomyces]|uniref:GNAT family N-acetyltransferase n=1 Tax=unclassified Streptomyces TaxID=2593676 RepID=UPI00224E82ED|nr:MULTISPECIES: GNAT family N-acetyltransferase [unclassified Streptomyces]MCX4990733.1 GNAT family N-acetyltransferase [Streptomyces sp. NBC_00568]MCX5004036.1 GNAT family N-acetyltransferase [Streptomyces sp. NBC_00638]
MEAGNTSRLDLVPLRVEHAEEMAEVLSDPALHTFIGGEPSTPQALRSRYERLVAGSPDPAVLWCNWVLRERTEGFLVGTVQATVSGDVAEIAWVVGTPWQGRGYAVEAARSLVRHVIRAFPVRTVVAHVHPAHHASAAVAAAAGLSPTGTVQDGEVRWELTVRR